MREIANYCIVFNHVRRVFMRSDGNESDNMITATRFPHEIQARTFINECDEPGDYEIWPIILTIETR